MISAALLLTAAPAPAPALQDLTDRFSVPEGLSVSLWAESPQLFNPTAMDVDARGRVWVTEAVHYRRWGGRNPGREQPGGDRVVILEDSDGDGRCDSSKVFVQDEDLVAPLGICVLGDTVFVSCSPHIFAYRDTDGDDVADEREIFLTGFGGHDHDHGVHSVVAGDDGWLYIAAGNAGPHLVTGSDGTTVRSGSIYTGGSPHNGENAGGLVSDDGRVWVGGIMLRVRRDGTGLEVLADNFRNQYEIARDAFGNLYTEDNDDDGNRGCRTTWVAEGGDYGYFSQDGSRSWRADRRPGQETQVAHWHADDPGVMPPGTINGAGGPTGVAIYESEYPGSPMAAFDGAVLNCDAGAGCVYAHFPEKLGGGLFLRSSQLIGHGSESGREPGDGKQRWFRPSDVLVMPDGSVLVADWYDPGVGGHAAGDRESYGRL
ncbi:MAG: dehydrogenase, partial [Planctomycetota bacterium]|nr:dehydrogenase [Planctomycetota bacterium]